MPRRRWDPQTKATIVLQGLKGMPVADICTEHQISQAQYYQWREQFMRKMPRLFSNTERREQSLSARKQPAQEDHRGADGRVKKLNEWSA